MVRQRILSSAMCLIALSTWCQGQSEIQVMSPSPPNVEYQYQMYYPRWYGWPGPGLSLGGSLPARGREGISSFYGRPLPVPLGSGVFMNSYAYAAQLPGPFAFGLSGAPTPQALPSPGVTQTGAGGTPQASAVQPATQTTNSPQPAMPSAAARQRSQEMRSMGDDQLKAGRWMQAFVNYQNAVDLSKENAPARVRLGFTSLALNRFTDAAREFKAALEVDPKLAQNGETMTDLFGPQSQSVQQSLTKNVAVWARENLKDQDRLFVLGFVLHYGQDARATEILTAAMRLPGKSDHVLAMLAPVQPDTQLVQAPPAEEADVAVSPAVSPRFLQRNLAASPEALPPSPIPESPDLPKLPNLHAEPLALQLKP